MEKDLGKLVECGFITNLHYYYTSSFPKSGFSSTSYNVQLLYNECTWIMVITWNKFCNQGNPVCSRKDRKHPENKWNKYKKLSKLRQACRRYGIGVAGISQDGKNADLVFYCRGIEGKANIKLENPGIMITLEIEEKIYKERKSE